jgi:pyruvate kinase
MRKTKIIATLGPATESEDALRGLIAAGVNIFRLNMSHAPHDWVRAVVKRIRKLEVEAGRKIGILLDTQGPAIRTGDLPTKLNLKVGDTFTFTVRGYRSEEQYSVDTNYDDLIKDINVGDVVLVDNGVIRMSAKAKDKNFLTCEVLTPGEMGSRRHINLPGVKVNLPPITDKDHDDIVLGMEIGVDIVALSFVRQASDIQELRDLLRELGRPEVSIVAKIEDQSAIRNINEIIAAADAVMVARGDLGIECPYEELPIIQRRVVKKCVSSVKPVIVATHMLESMIHNPIPTRAEITDVSNAVFEEADAVMLSGETTVGKYPRQCVEVLDRVAQRIERSGNIGFHEAIDLKSERENVAASGIVLANKLRADGIIVFTRIGRMAAICSGLRPRSTPIFAFCMDEGMAGRLTLCYGVHPHVIPLVSNPEENIRAAEAVLLQKKLLSPGARVVVVSDLLVEGKTVSTVQLRILSEAMASATYRD